MGSTSANSFLETLNSSSLADAARLLQPCLERAPWLASRVARRRPFDGIDHLGQCIEHQILSLDTEERLTLLRAHPELAPTSPEAMTQESQDEQDRLALSRPTASVGEQLGDLNRRYRRKHSFPFIIALHSRPSIESVLEAFHARLDQDTENEINCALQEVISVARSRLANAPLALAVPAGGVS